MKVKIKTLTEENNIEKLLKNNNFRNNQNYIISKTFYFNRYISNLDNFENFYSRLIFYFIILSIMIILYGINEIIVSYQDKNNSNFGLELVYFSIFLMFLTYFLFLFKHRFFILHRVNNYRIITEDFKNENVIRFKK